MVEHEPQSAQQERVRQLTESYEGPEKKEMAELYVDRVAKLKSAVMDSELDDLKKEKMLKRIDSYLALVDARSMGSLKKRYESLFSSAEKTLQPHILEQARDDREAKLEEVADLEIRQELLEEWKDATKFIDKYETKKKQIELLVKTKNLEAEGTELQYYLTSMAFHSDFLRSKLQEYFDTKDVGQKHERLQEIKDQGGPSFEVLTEVEKRVQNVRRPSDLGVIDLNDRNVLAEQTMFINRKRYDEAKKKLAQKIDEMLIPKDDPIRQQVDMMLQAADEQFETFKEAVFTAKNPEERTAAAEQANELLAQANSALEGAAKWLEYTDYKNAAVRGMSLAKILENEKCPPMVEKLFKTVPFFIMPQFAIGLGYYESAKQGRTTGEKVLEAADFGISLVPFAGGGFDVVQAFRGTTLSGRQMGTGERIVRGVIGVGSVVLDFFTFGLGGALIKAGGKTAAVAGAKLTAEAAAKAALEGSTKVVVETGVKAAAEAGVETGARVLGETGVRAAGGKVAGELTEVGVESAARTAAGAAGEGVTAGVQEAVNVTTRALNEAEKALLFKVAKGTASAAEHATARKVLVDVINTSLKPFAEKFGAEQAAKLAEQTAKIAARKTTGISGFAYRKLAGFTGGKWGASGIKGLEESIVKTGAQKTAVEAALKGGKEVGMGYFVKGEFVNEAGQVLWGGLAKSMGGDMAKSWWHLHNPMEVLRTLQSPVKFLSRVIRRVPRDFFLSKAALADYEQAMKANLIADGHNSKAVETIFADAKGKTWENFMKANEKNPIMKDPDVQKFFESFQKQFSGGAELAKNLKDFKREKESLKEVNASDQKAA